MKKKTEKLNKTEVKNNDILKISKYSEAFNFQNYGYMLNGEITTMKTFPKKIYEQKTFSEIIQWNLKNKNLYINKEEFRKVQKEKNSSAKLRISKDGFQYLYRQGSMNFPDLTNKPSRTMTTSESSLSRSSHFIKDNIKFKGKTKIRKITPIEAERLNDFPDNWTLLSDAKNDKYRYFLMGNALVVGIIEKIALAISKEFK